MGLIASVALLRVHVLVVELPGRPMLRLHAEAAVRARGWVVGTEPEDAELLLVCGTPQPEAAQAVDALWARLPRPRVRRTVRTAEEIGAALDGAGRVLADGVLQRRAAAEAGPPPEPPPRTRLGPLRPHWPAGLVVDCAVDAAGAVEAVGTRRLPADAASDDDDAPGSRAFVLTVADAARLLRLAGWEAPALRLDRVVDLALAGRPRARLRRPLRRVAGAVRRSATLGWVLTHEVPAPDVRVRVLALLDAARDGDAPPPAPRRVLVGQPLAALPLIVAATEPVAAGG